ncbi:MAG: ABC transporter ATP-binding protein [Anaerolineales bacterium]|nr:ABC transporter ATP-binding protein [Anaerolineales bacterium]
MSNELIETKDLWKIYGSNGVAVEAVCGIDLTVQPGEFCAIVGPSGSGKSSLLHLLAALDTPSRGEVFFAGRSIARLSETQRTDLRAREIGVIFQTFNLLPMLSVWENIEIALRLGGVPLAERRQRSTTLVEQVGLQERTRHLPRSLSGGERQRAAVARALANRPRLLLADEPTGNLDTQNGAAILKMLRTLADGGQTVVMVTHDFRAASYADRVLVLRDGRIRGETRLEGTPDMQQTVEKLFQLGL